MWCHYVVLFIAHLPGLLFSVFITAVLTDSIKDAVGRPRPDFFWRCFPNGKGVECRDHIPFRHSFDVFLTVIGLACT